MHGWRICLAVGLMSICGLAAAQGPFGGPFGGGDRSRDDRNRDDDRRREEDRRRSFDVNDVIRSADDNGDGIIDPSEVGSRSGYYIRRAAERAGLDASRPLPVDRIRPILEQLRNESSSGGSGSSSSSSGSSSSSRTPPPPNGPQAFGAPATATSTTAPKVPGFDVPLSVAGTVPLEQKFEQRVIDYVNEMLRERDANKNGVLEKNEWTGRWSTPPESSDKNNDGILSKEELCYRIAARFGGSGGSTSSPGGASSGSSGGSSSSGSDTSRFRQYAESLIRQNDKSGNGMLERSEAEQMRSEHRSADSNRDGVITLDELAAHLQAYSSGGSRYGSSDRDRGGYGYGSRSSSSSSSDKNAVVKKSYRFATPTERLPKGMPDWFLRGDADGDGQVSMAEYTSTWSDQVAAEFARLDLDADGVITPQEALPPPNSGSTPGSSGSSGYGPGFGSSRFGQSSGYGSSRYGQSSGSGGYGSSGGYGRPSFGGPSPFGGSGGPPPGSSPGTGSSRSESDSRSDGDRERRDESNSREGRDDRDGENRGRGEERREGPDSSRSESPKDSRSEDSREGERSDESREGDSRDGDSGRDDRDGGRQ